MREGPFKLADWVMLTLIISIVVAGVIGLRYEMSRTLHQSVTATTPACVPPTVSTPPVTYTDAAGIVVSLAPTVKKNDLIGYHLIKIEENGAQRYAIQYCATACAILGYRYQMDEKDYAVKKLHEFSSPEPVLPNVKLQEVIE